MLYFYKQNKKGKWSSSWVLNPPTPIGYQVVCMTPVYNYTHSYEGKFKPLPIWDLILGILSQ